MAIHIKIATDVKRSAVTGRNGTFDIAAIAAWQADNGRLVHLDGIGKRGTPIRGGLSIPGETMDGVCLEWARQRGTLPCPTAPAEPGSICLSIPAGADAYIYGRNGTFDVQRVHVWHGGGAAPHVFLDGIGKRGYAINGGLQVTLAAMDALALAWLKERGLSFAIGAPTSDPAAATERLAELGACTARPAA